MTENQKIALDMHNKLVKHEINLNCYDYKKANFDIAIEGLGWISIQGKGPASLILYLPDNVRFHIRDDPLRPYEANIRGLKKFHGNTINARTRRNIKHSSLISTKNGNAVNT